MYAKINYNDNAILAKDGLYGIYTQSGLANIA